MKFNSNFLINFAAGREIKLIDPIAIESRLQSPAIVPQSLLVVRQCLFLCRNRFELGAGRGSSFRVIVPDTVIFDDFERFAPTAATVSSSLLLGICSLLDTKFKVHELLKLYNEVEVSSERLPFKIPSPWQRDLLTERKGKLRMKHNLTRGRSLKQNFPNRDKICASCPRTLKEDFDYCSINFMVKQLLETEGNIVGHLRRFPPLPLKPVEADEELVPADLILRDPATTGSMINGTRRADGLKGKKKNNEEPSPSALVCMHRRKGVPKRSPFC